MSDGSTVAFALASALFYTIGIKLIADGLKASGNSIAIGLICFGGAFALFIIATPILFFLVLGFATP